MNLLTFNSRETRAGRSLASVTLFRRIEPQVLKGFIELAQAGLPINITESLGPVLFCSVETIFTKSWIFAGVEPPTAFIKKIGIRMMAKDLTEGQSAAA